MVPFETERETEQGDARGPIRRARGLVHRCPQSDLTPERLAEAIDAALKSPPPDRDAIRLDGAQATATLLAQWVTGRGSAKRMRGPS